MSYDEHYSNYYTYDLGNMLLPNALIEEVERVSKEREDLLGLEECYKKVCKVSLKLTVKVFRGDTFWFGTE